MVMPTQSAPRLLVIDDDDDLRLFLLDLLNEEGYIVDSSSTMGEALAAINSHVYHLIVTDLLAHSAVDPLRSAIAILEAASPTPVMTLTGWSVTADEVAHAGLIRMVPKPFDITDLLSAIAACSKLTLNPHQQRWAEIVHGFCAALNANNLDALVALCTDDVRIAADLGEQQDSTKKISGRASYRTRLEQCRSTRPDVRFDEYVIYPQSNGIALRGVISWQAPGAMNGRSRLVTSMVFQFAGQLISQLTIRATDSRHVSLQTQSASLRGNMETRGK